MSKRLFSAAAAVLVVGGFAVSAHAKPPDLPVSYEDSVGSAEVRSQEQQAPTAQNNNSYGVPEAGLVKPLPTVGVSATVFSSDAKDETAAAQQINNFYDVPTDDPNLPLPAGEPRYSDGGVILDGSGYLYFQDEKKSTTTSDSEDACPCLCETFQQFLHAVSSYMTGNAASEGDDDEAAEPESTSQDEAQPEVAAPSTSCPKARKPRSKPERLSHSDTAQDVEKVLAARRLYQIGQRCLQAGDLDMATNCFEESHLLAPTSRYGLRAIDRLSEIEQLRGTEETSDAEQQEQAATQANHRTSARQMYHIGERCRRAGDRDMALNCFNETRLLCPASVYGRLAAQRIEEMEAERAADEEAEPRDAPEATPPADQGETLCPHGKPTDARLQEGETLERATAPDKPRLEIQQKPQSAAPAGNVDEQEDESTDELPLYVDPPARKLTIEEQPQKPEE
jgi:hypothetical protein